MRMMSGELYSLILTGERIVGAREAAQVNTREAGVRRQAAERRVGEAEAWLAAANRSNRSNGHWPQRQPQTSPSSASRRNAAVPRIAGRCSRAKSMRLARGGRGTGWT